MSNIAIWNGDVASTYMVLDLAKRLDDLVIFSILWYEEENTDQLWHNIKTRINKSIERQTCVVGIDGQLMKEYHRPIVALSNIILVYDNPVLHWGMNVEKWNNMETVERSNAHNAVVSYCPLVVHNCDMDYSTQVQELGGEIVAQISN